MADFGLLHFDLRPLADFVRSVEILASHPPQHGLAAEMHAVDGQIEPLLGLGGVHDSEREEFVVGSERGDHILFVPTPIQSRWTRFAKVAGSASAP